MKITSLENSDINKDTLNKIYKEIHEILNNHTHMVICRDMFNKIEHDVQTVLNNLIKNKTYTVTVNTLYNKYNYEKDGLLDYEINKLKSIIILDIKEA